MTDRRAYVIRKSYRQHLYVALSRGVQDNHAYVTCEPTEGGGAGPDPLAVLTAIVERGDHPEELAAVAYQQQSADEVRSLATLFPIWQDLIDTTNRQRWQTALEGSADHQTAGAMVASATWPTLAARLRAIDTTGADSAAALAHAAATRPLAGADDIAAVLHGRLRHSETAAIAAPHATFAQISPTGGGDLAATIADIAAVMDARSQQLAACALTDPPPWAAVLGPPPQHDDEPAAVEWRRRAGVVAGYREAFRLDQAISDDLDPIGPAPPPTRPDARAWWQRAATALNRTEPGLANLPGEHLEALVDQAHQADAASPAPVAEQLRAVHEQLRAARTAHGHAIANHRPQSEAVLRAAQAAQALADSAAQLEAAHQRREQWRHTTNDLHAQAAQAAAELAARADARAGAPFADLDGSALLAELARTEQHLWAATRVAERHETLASTCRNQAADLATQIAHLTATRPHLTVAETTIAAERAVAARLDELHATLDSGRLIRRVRGAARQQLTDEMHELTNTNPGLAVEPARREHRWATIAQRAEHADQRQLNKLQTELDHATTQAHHHTAAAIPARAEVDKQTQRAPTLHAELARPPQPPQGHKQRGPSQTGGRTNLPPVRSAPPGHDGLAQHLPGRQGSLRASAPSSLRVLAQLRCPLTALAPRPLGRKPNVSKTAWADADWPGGPAACSLNRRSTAFAVEEVRPPFVRYPGAQRSAGTLSDNISCADRTFFAKNGLQPRLLLIEERTPVRARPVRLEKLRHGGHNADPFAPPIHTA